MDASLSDKRLLIVTGKGGVGKTTISAALALDAARRGRRTLICEVNTRERVSQLLGKPEVGPEITSLEENLWAVNVQPQEALREYALMVLKFESIYSAVFENRVVRYFLRFIPSLQELVLLGKILFHLKEKRPDGSWRFDCIVIDAPATGHAITFLSVPQVIVDTVPPGALSNDASWMRDLLVDRQTTAAVLVSLPEELPVNETLELHQALVSRVKLAPQLVVLNGFIPERFSQQDQEATASPLAKELMRAHAARVGLSLASKETLSRLGLPVVTVPRIFVNDFGRAAIEQIVKELEGGPRP
ncbi:MAG: ArsA family ATPase [Myxococcaceae bacterium]|nr:ArsA family ATPase [Myxococcaceae bacterium]